jgi:hypothetical protein
MMDLGKDGGHTSHHGLELVIYIHGLELVIDIQSGYCLDYHVLSNFCLKCSLNPNPTEERQAKHKMSCNRNHAGSAGSKEQEVTKILWSRSEETHHFAIHYLFWG